MEAGEIEQGVVEWKSTLGLSGKEDGEPVASPPSVVPRLFMSIELCLSVTLLFDYLFISYVFPGPNVMC